MLAILLPRAAPILERIAPMRPPRHATTEGLPSHELRLLPANSVVHGPRWRPSSRPCWGDNCRVPSAGRQQRHALRCHRSHPPKRQNQHDIRTRAKGMGAMGE